MKKIITLFTIALIAFGTTAEAQIQRGNLLVGGDIADFNLNLNGGGYFSMRLNPKIAFFLQDNVALGPYVNLGLTTAKGAGTNVNYGVGAFGRYYINPTRVSVLRHGRFFLEGSVGIEGDNTSNGESTNGLGLGVGPGFAYFITPNVGLETLLKYTGIVGFGSRPTASNLDLGVGFQIYLPTHRLRDLANNP